MNCWLDLICTASPTKSTPSVEVRGTAFGMPRHGVSGDLQIAHHKALAIIERMGHGKRAGILPAEELKDRAVERLLPRRDGHFALHRIDRRFRKEREGGNVIGMRVGEQDSHDVIGTAVPRL